MNGTSKNPGIKLRTIQELFKIVKKRESVIKYSIKCSIFQIYNEKICDLLNQNRKNRRKSDHDLEIRHLPDGNVYVEGLEWKKINKIDDFVSAQTTAQRSQCTRSHMGIFGSDVKKLCPGKEQNAIFD